MGPNKYWLTYYDVYGKEIQKVYVYTWNIFSISPGLDRLNWCYCVITNDNNPNDSRQINNPKYVKEKKENMVHSSVQIGAKYYRIPFDVQQTEEIPLLMIQLAKNLYHSNFQERWSNLYKVLVTLKNEQLIHFEFSPELCSFVVDNIERL